MNLELTEIGKDWTQGNEENLVSSIKQMEWHSLPVYNIGFMQGEGIKGIIKEWKIPAKRISFNAFLGPYLVYGIETKKQQIFFLELGSEIVPLAIYNKTELEIAFQYGKQAYHDGKHRVPAVDIEFLKMFKNREVGDNRNLPLLDKWLEGWDEGWNEANHSEANEIPAEMYRSRS